MLHTANGAGVGVYGLFAVHTLRELVLWRGERGRTYFYQCELPYDVNQTMFGDRGFAGYRVDAATKTHECVAPGIYSYFRDYPCLVQAAIVAPDTDEVTFMNAFTKKLRGHEGIQSVERYDTAAWRAAAPSSRATRRSPGRPGAQPGRRVCTGTAAQRPARRRLRQTSCRRSTRAA